jgi:tetratricopeptide (TPR) repeat protein
MWVAATVLFGLLVGAGAGGFLLRGVVGQSYEPPTQAEIVGAEVEKWSAQVAKDPESVPPHLELAYALQADGQLERALEEYAYVIRRDPANTAAHYQRGVIYLGLGLGKEGEAALWKVLEYEPEHVQAAVALGRFYADGAQYRSIVTTVRPAVVAHPHSAELQFLLGLAYEHMDHTDWAIARYNLSLKASPDYAEAHQGLTRLGARPAN